MKPYFILMPDWSNVSGGGALLHSFAVRLHRLGMEVYVSTNAQNPLWEKLPTLDVFKGDRKNVIAVYPEVTHGNPYHCGHVVRLLLHLPAFFGGPKEFDKDDLLFTHSDIFNHEIGLPEDHVLHIPYLNTDVFCNQNLKRDKIFAYKNKGIGHYPHPKLKNIPLLGTGFDFDGKEGQALLCDVLNKTKVLYCYDNITAMVDIARLCGCAVVIIPDPAWKEEAIRKFDGWDIGGIGYGLEEEAQALKTINPTRMRMYYQQTFEQRSFNDLKRFIAISQKKFGGWGADDGVVKFSVTQPFNFKNHHFQTHKKYEMPRSEFYSAWFMKSLIKQKKVKVLEDTARHNGKNKPIQWPLRGENKHVISDKPLVSICCLTYNHEQIIRDALEGFVMQRTDFPFEIVVCDDASTDKTQSILKEYAEKYEGLFKLILLKENQFSKTKVLPFATHLFPAAKGKYIAECDGDDYWTDCYKLQRQFDFLEKHPECSMCYHDLVIYYEDQDMVANAYTHRPPDYSPEALAGFENSGMWLHPSTKMWRNLFNEKTKKDFETCWGDNATNVHMSIYGGCGFVENISPSVFRRFHGNNMWSVKPAHEIKKETIEIFRRLYNFMKKKNERFAEIRLNILRGYEV